MSDRKIARATQTLLKQVQKIARKMTRGLIAWLLRANLLAYRRSSRVSIAGFVLPTTVLLLLVVALTVGALVIRAGFRTNQVIGQNQQRVIYNAATPAIDRARSKLENLFNPNSDPRYPGGVPSESFLLGMLRNDNSCGVPQLGTAGNDPYTLPGETRVNLDGATRRCSEDPASTLYNQFEASGADNAWTYRADTDGDGTLDATVIYSILMQTPLQPSQLLTNTDQTKVNNLWVRHGPLSNEQRTACNVKVSPEGGWFQDSNSTGILRKNFQVNALVIPDSARTSGNFTTLEFHQDRQLDRGNKWGAWFRYDLELHPGPQFNWNGAMHTEGNLMITSGNGFNAYLVSAPASCLMQSASNSEISVTSIPTPATATDPPRFEGLTVPGSMRDNNLSPGAGVNIHLWDNTTAAGPGDIVQLTNENDSAVAALGNPATIALDPVKLLTEGVSQARGADPTNVANFLPNIPGPPPTYSFPPTDTRPRISNKREPAPYVDDLYRADNRWGPKPRYGQSGEIVLTGAAQSYGNLIDAGNVTAPEHLGQLTNTPDDPAEQIGLDGYWERRARAEGLRVIVGQRLELGNTFGWTNNDPLYPPDTAPAARAHEARQRRTLRDNLAAVQATAIYHHASTGGRDFPVACLASTAHPGTAQTLQNSTRFDNTTINGTQTLIVDFLNGRGTNGWEFAPPGGTEANFAASVDATAPLGKALRNLANFAGDHISNAQTGAFPPTQEAGQVHPAPTLTMWGNYSELRRTIARLDAVGYAALSPADKTTLHTAACTLGMLAYNLQTVQSYNLADVTNEGNGGNPGLGMLGVKMFDLIDGKRNNGEVRDPTTGNYFPFTGNNNPGANYATQAPAAYAALPPQAFIQALLTEPIPGLSNADRTELVRIAYTVLGKQQAERDRLYGFANGTPPPPTTTSGYWAANGKTYEAQVGGVGTLSFPTDCDPETFPLNNSGNPTAQRNGRVGLAMAFCNSTPFYPALFYLFPRPSDLTVTAFSHDHAGVSPTAALSQPQPGSATYTGSQLDEPYITDPYVNTANPTTVPYQMVGATADDFTGVALQPKAADFSNWVLPNAAPQNVAGANVSSNVITSPAGAPRAVGFLDRVVMNGREMMPARVMDLDIGMLRSLGSNAFSSNTPWLPGGRINQTIISGIVYAFREDGVREDAIARPANGTNPENVTNLTNPLDPERVDPGTGIRVSPKAVSYYPDPDRRVHGFRLRNGSQVKRNDSFGIAATDNIRGITLVSDNPVYIQGDFNLHQTGADDTAGTRLEEFTQLLPAGGLYNNAQFYGRTTPDPNFAQAGDRWRPTEILADAVSVLSNNFCDGSLQDVFVAPSAADLTTYASVSRCSATPTATSFLDFNRPTNLAPTGGWAREDGTATNASNATPIKIDRNGNPLTTTTPTAYAGTYQTFADGKTLIAATDTRINAVVVQGIVPSRPNQPYGGLHNFPRFLENWGGRNLWFAGSFLQLNFSNYATAPFDQDAWEPTQTPAAAENIRYYSPPNRLWGYDPGLQLAPAAPAAARFITLNRTRTEFYDELPLNDPYINKLCTVAKAQVPEASNINCPT